ncbi:MAG: hypothetical protein U0586_05570 [Candidatus Brocadiaceae bacterium]
MTRTIHFDGTLHIVIARCTTTGAMRFVFAKRNRPLHPYSVIASEAKQSFSHKKTLPPDKG